MIEESLEDEFPEFQDSKLHITSNNDSNPANNSEKQSNEDVDKPKEKNNCQWSTAFVTPITNKISETLWNTKQKTLGSQNENSLQPKINIEEDANRYFSFREEVINKAVNECKEQLLCEDDGEFVKAFLLTQIHHWDTEKERLVLLTSNTIALIKYDFIAMKRLDCRKLKYSDIDEVMIGSLVYPNKSLMPDRNMKGLRIMFNKGEPIKFKTIWNPFNDQVPFWTFTYHPLHYQKDEKISDLYNLDTFLDQLLGYLNTSQPNVLISYKNIVMENYIGLGSVIHNRSSLGFFKVRGKFSF